MERRLASLSLLVAVLALSGAARGDERAARVAGADALFREGEQLFGAGNVPAACEKFAASQNLDPALGTLINLAICHAREGKTGSAWLELKDALAQATARGQSSRVEAIGRELADLEPRLSHVVLDFAGATVDSVRVDGRPLDRAAWSAPIALDPGAHSFEIGVAGKAAQTITVTVAAGPSSQTVTVRPPAETPHVGPAPRPASPPRAGGGTRMIGYVVGGVGIAALAVGAGFGLAAAAKKSDADDSCQGRYGCPREGYDANNAAHTDATISTIAFGVGIAAIGAGAFLVLTSPSARKATASVRVAPTPFGLRLDGRF